MRFPKSDGYQRRCEQIDRLENWHACFAWFPVRINAWQLAWLETVERKGIWGGCDLGWCFEYRSLEKQS